MGNIITIVFGFHAEMVNTDYDIIATHAPQAAGIDNQGADLALIIQQDVFDLTDFFIGIVGMIDIGADNFVGGIETLGTAFLCHGLSTKCEATGNGGNGNCQSTLVHHSLLDLSLDLGSCARSYECYFFCCESACQVTQSLLAQSLT